MSTLHQLWQSLLTWITFVGPGGCMWVM